MTKSTITEIPILRSAITAVALCASALALARTDAAATPINPVQDGVVHSCFHSRNGRNFRLIDPNGACKTKETPLQWGQQGPKGDTGAPGLSGYEVVKVDQPISAAGGWVFDAACPNGKTAISGGFSVPGNVTQSHPRDGDPTVWRLAFSVPGPTTITLYLQCARTQ